MNGYCGLEVGEGLALGLKVAQGNFLGWWKYSVLLLCGDYTAVDYFHRTLP